MAPSRFSRTAHCHAACTFSAAQARLAALEAGMWPADWIEVQRSLVRLRAQLGEDAFAAAYDKGRSLGVPAAITAVREALERLPAGSGSAGPTR